MPRFYFDFHQNGERVPDTEGCEFATVEDAYLSAFRAAKDMWSELLGQRQDPRRCRFEIHDSARNLLFVLPFWEVLESCHDHPKQMIPIRETVRDTVATVTKMRQAQKNFLEEMQRSREALRQSARLIATSVP